MQDSTPTPQINVSKIPGGGGIAGALFAVISLVIFLIGIPALRYFLLGAIVVGAAAALVIRALRGNTPGAPCTLFAPSTDARSHQNDSTAAPPHSHRCMLRVVSPVA
jgi:hypothetical protein